MTKVQQQLVLPNNIIFFNKINNKFKKTKKKQRNTSCIKKQNKKFMQNKNAVKYENQPKVVFT